MKIDGESLKELFCNGIEENEERLSTTMLRVFIDFQEEVHENKQYDLFSVLSIIVLKIDTDLGAMIAKLMSSTDLNQIQISQLANLGNFFSDFLKREKLLEHYHNKLFI